MAGIERSVEVEVPASTAYDAWTQFERFPEFMEGVEEVRQKDDRHLHWRVNLWGKVEEWDAEITEQIPDKRIAWRAERGTPNAGVVTFHRLADDRAEILLHVRHEPRGLGEKAADAVGLLSRRVEGDLQRFKAYVEGASRRPQGWRGEIPAKPDAAQRRE